jgi:hypothetical protein
MILSIISGVSPRSYHFAGQGEGLGENPLAATDEAGPISRGGFGFSRQLDRS